CKPVPLLRLALREQPGSANPVVCPSIVSIVNELHHRARFQREKTFSSSSQVFTLAPLEVFNRAPTEDNGAGFIELSPVLVRASCMMPDTEVSKKLVIGVWIPRRQVSILRAMATVALTELLGAPVFDVSGKARGRVRELALAPQEDRARVAILVVRTKAGDRLLPFASVVSINGGIRARGSASHWAESNGGEGYFFLERDLLDQQVIDVHGRKVVRVNDVDLH